MSPCCPRCGYDLSGVASSWQGCCPLAGTCSECGLDVRWGDVLNPRLTIPRWSFEHAPRRLAAGRLVATLWRSMLPRRFWRSLRLEHPVVAGWLLVYLFTALGFAHVAAFLSRIVLVDWANRMWFRKQWFSGISPGQAAVQSVWPYRLSGAWDVLNGRWSRWMDADGWTLLGYPHYFLLGWAVFTPLAFLTLSETLQRVRVRNVHLFRAGVYPVTVVLVVLVIQMLLFMLDGRLSLLGSSFGSRHPGEPLRWLVFLLGMGWFAWSWWVIPREYLRLPHARGVSAAMLGIGALASAVVMAFLAIYETHR